MNHRSLSAAALVATAALLLTACGGSGNDKSKDTHKIAGADQSTVKPSSPSSRPTDSQSRPKITLPSDVKNVFANWKTGDPAKDSVLADVAYRINATDEAITAGTPDAPPLPFYYQGDALLGAADWIQGYKKDGLSITGTTRYYNAQVQMSGMKSATVIYCSDESKAFDKVRSTGKPKVTPVTDDAYVLYNSRLEKNKKGVWQTVKLASKRGQKTCM